jgi:hypothetical protein
MKKNSNAFTIIKSLTMSEKRYFKIFSERHTIGEQNKYVVLFNVLDKIEIEHDVEIKNQLSKKNINSDFLSADKNYLYSLVLKSLNDFHGSKTFNLQIKESLISIEILFHKGLYKECLSLIYKAEILAEECENFSLMIDLLMWKKKCSGYSLGLKKAAEVNLSIDKYLVLLNNFKRITDLYYQSNLLQSANENNTKSSVLNELKNILKQPELTNEKNALSFSAKIFYYLIYANYYSVIKDQSKELDCLQKLTNILNASKTYAVENPLDYISIYNRLLSIKKYFPSSSFFEDIKMLNEFGKKIQIRKEVVVQRVFIHANTHEIEYYLINNNFHQASYKIKEIEKEISKLNFDIEPFHMIYFYYLHAIILIFVGEFHKSLKYINKTLNDFAYDDRPQVYLRIEILNCIVHYELKNYSLVLSLAKKTLKNNLQQSLLVLIEQQLLQTLIKICETKYLTPKIESALFQDLLDTNNGAKLQAKSKSSSLEENYQKWIIAKVKRKLVSEIF